MLLKYPDTPPTVVKRWFSGKNGPEWDAMFTTMLAEYVWEKRGVWGTLHPYDGPVNDSVYRWQDAVCPKKRTRLKSMWPGNRDPLMARYALLAWHELNKNAPV